MWLCFDDVLLYKLQGPMYVAMYDYDAQDDDEVSFLENDRITLYEMIDDGWMYGIVQRTGHKGMIPANYVELVQWIPRQCFEFRAISIVFRWRVTELDHCCVQDCFNLALQ